MGQPPLSSPRDRRRLGEILVDGGAITPEQLTRGLAEQATLNLPLGQTLLRLGYTTDAVMRQALSSQIGVAYIDLQNVIIDRTLAGLVDRDFALTHSLFPVARIGRTLTVAMDDPTAANVIDELAASSEHSITVVTSSSDAIHRAINRLYEQAGQKAPASAAPIQAGTAVLPKGVHGYVALVGLTSIELLDVVRAVEDGLPYGAFDMLVKETGLSADQVATFADLTRQTVTTRQKDGRFLRDESDRLVRAARVFAATAAQLGGSAVATAWLLTAQPTLDGCVPLELARTELGAREVEAALVRLSKAAAGQRP